tara:strand:+ start:170 stop:1069 length:900 start_codon:yes stop_codon:yes gene_type:complete
MDCQKLLVYGLILLLGMYILRDVCGINIAKVLKFEGNTNGGNNNVAANNNSRTTGLAVAGEGPSAETNGNNNVAANNNEVAANNNSNSNEEFGNMEGFDNSDLLSSNGIAGNTNTSNELMNSMNALSNSNVSAMNAASANAAAAAAANAASANAAAANTASSNVNEGGISASEPGDNTFHMPIQGIQTAPASCYPQNQLTADDLLPEGSSGDVKSFNQGLPEIGEGILKGVNFLDAGFHVGVNTVGQSLRNANLNLRAEPPNPRTQVSPWMNSTIDMDLARRPLNDGECVKTSPGQTLP